MTGQRGTGEPARAQPAWIAVGSAYLVGVAALLAWLFSTPTGVLREQLKTLQFWSLEACALTVCVLGIAVAREIRRDMERRDIRRMAILAVLAIGLTVFVAPRTNRIYYDELIYQNIGQNMADLKLAQMCNDGVAEYGRLECANGEYNKEPYAYPHLLSLVYRMTGVREADAFLLNAAVMAATVCAVYLLVLLLFEDATAAFFAALLVLLIPEQIIWSATAAVEPSASLALVGALVWVAHFCRSRSPVALAAAAAAVAYSVQFRPESLLILPVVGLLVWQRAPEELARPRFWWAGLIFLALVAAHLGHTFAVRNEQWGTTSARLSFGYVPANFAVNGRFYIWDERFPVLVTLLAILGLTTRRALAGRAFLALYFAVFFGIGLLFYAGSYNYGADVRYSVMTHPAVAALGGLGAAHVVRWLERFRPRLPADRLLAAGLAFQFLWYAPLVRATTEEAWAARADVRFAQSLVPALRGNSYVLTHNPGMFQVWGINAGQMSLALTNPGFLDYLAGRYAGGVYLHWNFWCNVQDPLQRGFCEKAVGLKAVELVREHKERNQRFALYRLKVSDVKHSSP